jgi:hypothetical protein
MGYSAKNHFPDGGGMFRRTSARQFCAIEVIALALLATSAARAGDDAAANTRVPFLHDGLAITASWYAMNHAGRATDFKEDENGGWTAPDGSHLDASNRPSTSAGGVSECVVSCIDGEKVFLVYRTYTDMRALGLPDPVLQGSPKTFMANLDKSDLWIDPATLAQMQSDPASHLAVVPLQWKKGDQAVDAVRVIRITPDHYIDHVFEKSTGLCLHAAESSIGTTPQLKYLAPGDTAGGDTQLSVFDFIAMRDVKTPRDNEPMPPWTSQFKVLHYRGQSALPNPWVNGPPKQLGLDVSRLDNGNGWMSLSTLGWIYVRGQPAYPTKGVYISGHDQYDGFFAGPDGLATLRQGQVLDTDPVTHVKTSVAQADASSVTIAYTSQSGQAYYTYDRQAGKLIGFGTYSNMTRIRTSFQLQGQE